MFFFFHRYVQCVDLSSGSAFELPQYQTALNKSDHTAFDKQRLPDSRHDTLGIFCEKPYLNEAWQPLDPESHYLEIPNTQKLGNSQSKFVISDFSPLSPNCDAKKTSLSLMGATQEENLTIPMEDRRHHLSNGQLEHQRDVTCLDSTDEKYTQIENIKNTSSSNENGYNENKQGPHSGTDSDPVQTYQRIESWSNLPEKLIMPLFETCNDRAVESLHTNSHKDDTSNSQSLMHPSSSDSNAQLTEQKVTTVIKNDSSLISHHGIVVGIDNSNIYIGAQECASMVNPGDRKRHVRLKLQNLVRILERERSKMRGFACGSSPPATEHVWEVYR